MNNKNQNTWWDYSYLLEDMAERLLNDAHMYRTKGMCMEAGKTADEMEECAWAMLDAVDYDFKKPRKQKAAIRKFTKIMKNRITTWWD